MRQYINVNEKLSEPTWKNTLAGLLGSVLRGGTLGFSDYLSNDLKRESSKFSERNPGTAVLANLLGAIGGTALGSTEEAIAAKGGELATKDIIGRFMPTKTAEELGKKLISHSPILAKLSDTVVPGAISSAIQGGTYAFNTSDNNDSNAINRAIEGATIGGLGGAGINKLIKSANPVIRRILNRGESGNTNQENKAIKHTLQASGLEPTELINRLMDSSNNSRVYDVDPIALGSKGLLNTISRTYPNLGADIRSNALSDINKLSSASNVLTEKYLGDTLPGSFSDYINKASKVRSDITKPLYETAQNANIDLSAHPELLGHYVLGHDFTNYLNRELPNLNPDRATIRDIARFLDNRKELLHSGNDMLAKLGVYNKKKYINGEELNRLYANTIDKHIAFNKPDLSLPRPLIRGYLDELTANRPDISRMYSRLEPNAVDDITRLVDATKRAIQEVSPEDAIAQQTYKNLSLPLNQADLARTLTKTGTQDKLSSEVTSDYINANNELRKGLSNAKLTDNSRPLSRFVLDEAITNAIKNDKVKTPKAILSTIDSNIKPRLEAVFGTEPIDKLLNEAKINEDLINNRTGLTKIGFSSNDPTHVDIPHYPSLYRITYDKVADIYRNLIGQKTNKSLANFLHKNPTDAINLINEYTKINPAAKLDDYNEYINASLGNLFGESINPSYTDNSKLKWDPIKRQAYYDIN